ncbi:MAG: HAD-IIIA family hydrolase, partial [Owenweeksia sp.]
MKAVILAGGKGTRLGKLTKDIPKPMIPVMGKPLLEYQVELCARYGLEEVILLVNHLKDPIRDHFLNGADFGIPISYFEEKEPLGTVGGVKEIEERLTEDFLVLYGDVMMEMDLNRLMGFHRSKKSQATLVVHPNDHPYDSDLVEMDSEDYITSIHPKPHPEGFRYHNMVNAAAYILSPEIFKYLEKGVKADFGKDIFPNIVSKLRMYGYNTPEYLKDMGTPDRLEQVEKDLKSGKVKQRSLSNPQKALFLDRDGVLNYDTDLIHRPEDFNLYPFAIDAVKKINQSNYISVVTTNQSVVARNLTTIEGLGEIHKKMETLLGNEGAKLDAIFYCPHHPDSGYP